tara:strand:- start:94 stop:552 length:459 start_codon:yes stop_codon:yes gene_type:complete
VTIFLMCAVRELSDHDLTLPGSGYALVCVTGDLQEKIQDLIQECRGLKSRLPSFNRVSLWDYSIWYLDQIPFEWVEWCDENVDDTDEWVEVPFGIHTEDLSVVRTECDQMVADELGVWWTANPKHSSVVIETPRLPELSDLEQLALTADGGN